MYVVVVLILGCFSLLRAEGSMNAASSPNASDSSSQSATSLQPGAPMTYAKECKNSFDIFGDVLFWMTTEEGLIYGVSGGPTSNPFGNIPNQDYTVTTIHPEMNVGVRLTGKYNFQGMWDTAWIWTHYYNSQSASTPIAQGNGQGFDAMFMYLLNAISSQGGDATWHLLFNVGDIEIARVFYPDNQYTLRTHAGVRGAWVHQSIRANYYDISIENQTPTTITATGQLRNLSQAYGLRVGIDNDWFMGWGFRLLANGSFSLLTSHFKNIQNTYFSEGSLANLKYENLDNKVFLTTEVLELMGGFGWEYCWGDERALKSLDVRLVWEENLWFHQNQLIIYTAAYLMEKGMSVGGNLGFSGPVLTVGLTF